MADTGFAAGDVAGRHLLDFIRTLRLAGMHIEITRVRVFVQALAVLQTHDLVALHLAGRVTICSSAADIALYDRCFATFFLQGDLNKQNIAPDPEAPPMLPGSAAAMQRREVEDQRELDIGATSPEEKLRHRSLAQLSDEEKDQVYALISRMKDKMAQRSCRRRKPSQTGGFDMRMTVRSALKRAGDPDRVHRRRRRSRPRRRVLLLDVSGSMSPYAGGHLRLAYAAYRSAPGHTEVFTIGTRLTRITPYLRDGDAERAIIRASAAIPDWSGGTRLGDQLKAFVDIWGHRGMARGAILVLASDGWERGETAMLATQMQRLGRLAKKIIWVNPHASTKGFEPLTRGMQAALPFVDTLVAGSTANELEKLLRLFVDRK